MNGRRGRWKGRLKERKSVVAGIEGGILEVCGERGEKKEWKGELD